MPIIAKINNISDVFIIIPRRTAFGGNPSPPSSGHRNRSHRRRALRNTIAAKSTISYRGKASGRRETAPPEAAPFF
ncbi:hypothetical protein [Neorhizobium galegae]|uniref:hypothetical protein n=1 Tax=Neorhizobium galegae TaxID=399 RepID=UPI0020354006|nr:hypothetical protein [Neorhizobium galegae]MCM2501810.1 hypothetical protein [Neorhizobium galegae]MCQ1768048.1 hypothetical protein [Neorhizobium galegae]MCQ1772581.1 hypothetical protein [Neorhizobium galegae]MCQ1778137.1 hypothetical protein [Neorhizobium galegae]MCQ1796878.1 hypothetical protein [Neorhizobium galegae]